MLKSLKSLQLFKSALILLCGCNSPENIDGGGDVDLKLAFINPLNKEKISINKKSVNCTVEVVSANGRQPQAVVLELVKGVTVYDQENASLDRKKEGDIFVYKSNIKIPKELGRYKLRASGFARAMSHPPSGDPSMKPIRKTVVRQYNQSILIEIVK